MASKQDPIQVTGPNLEGRGTVSVGAGISLALTYATKRDAPVGTWYVRQDGERVAYVEKDEDGIVTAKASRS